MHEQGTTPQLRDGFVVVDEDGQEVHFTPCAYSGNMRDKAFMGMLRNTDIDRFDLKDTRDAD